MSSARHARPRISAPDPVGPTPKGRHRAASRPVALHPGVIGTAAAVVAVGGVVVLRGDVDPLRAAVSAGAPATPGGRAADSAAASRGSVRDALTGSPDVTAAVVPGSGKHRKAEAVPAEPKAAAAAQAVAQAVTQAVTQAATQAKAEATAAAKAAARAKARAKACGFSASTQRTPELTRTQRRNARTIVDVALARGLPPRAAVIALATAQQESELINIHYGDRDSLGLFQQRPSQGWGSPSQVLRPEYAAKAFYSALVDVDGWQRLPLTVAAQRVQRSAFGWAYARWELLAATAVDDLLDLPDDELSCTRD